MTALLLYFAQTLALLVVASLCPPLPLATLPQPAAQKAKMHCPVVGVVQEAKGCGCPSGYCSRNPKEQHTLDYKAGKILFCCGMCVEQFKKTPEPFSATANHQLAASGQARQTACPVCGGVPYVWRVAEIAGIQVGFCSDKCGQKVTEAKGQAQLELVFGNTAFDRGFTVVAAKRK